MALAVRAAGGRFENNQRAYEKAVEVQRQQLTRILVGAGVSAVPIRWGHSGELSLNSLAAIVNYVAGTHIHVPEVHPADYELKP
jgi:hypothetical protein